MTTGNILDILERLIESSKKGGRKIQEIQVECHSGYKVNEYPVAFTFQGQRRIVSEIVDRWYEGGISPEKPTADYFKVKTDDGRIYILMYEGYSDKWFMRSTAADSKPPHEQ